MRIIAGVWRNKRLIAPTGHATRPTSERLRQSIFDMLMHAAWGGRALLEDADVLDAFAGTGALGLEALSRGAARAVFIERDGAALAALRANVLACGAEGRAQILAADVMRPPKGDGQRLAFLDPPYGQELLQGALAGLRLSGWLIPGTVVVAEASQREIVMIGGSLLARKMQGTAQISVWREG